MDHKIEPIEAALSDDIAIVNAPPSSVMKGVSPTGVAIVGTVEHMPGVARIASFSRASDGSLDWKWAGINDANYDLTETVMRDGKTVFQDETGAEWLDDEIVLVEPRTAQDGAPRLAVKYIRITGWYYPEEGEVEPVYEKLDLAEEWCVELRTAEHEDDDEDEESLFTSGDLADALLWARDYSRENGMNPSYILIGYER